MKAVAGNTGVGRCGKMGCITVFVERGDSGATNELVLGGVFGGVLGLFSRRRRYRSICHGELS